MALIARHSKVKGEKKKAEPKRQILMTGKQQASFSLALPLFLSVSL